MFSGIVSNYGRGSLRVSRRPSGVLIVAFARPQVRNAFNDDLYLDLVDILRQAAVEDDISAVILTGMGDFFSSGADLSDLHTITPENRREMAHLPAGKFMVALVDFPKVICAAVNGPAVGIAATLLLHCDLVFCSKTASFWAPFARLALCPELASSITLTNVMGLSKANEILLLSRRLDAKTMVEWNIASRIVPETDVVSGDPFTDDGNSLALHMARHLENHLLSLPLGNRTAAYFVQAIKSPRRAALHQALREEFAVLDERFNTGQVQVAAQSIEFGRRQKKNRGEEQRRSKL